MDLFPEEILDTYLLPFMHLYTSRAVRTLSGLQLHPGQLPVLFLVSRQEGQTLRQLADALLIKPPTVTVTVQRLEKAGLLKKQADADDQRACRIYLTPLGRQTLTKARQIALENHAVATRGLTEEDLAHLKRCFLKMSENLKQEGPTLPCLCQGKDKPCVD